MSGPRPEVPDADPEEGCHDGDDPTDGPYHDGAVALVDVIGEWNAAAGGGALVRAIDAVTSQVESDDVGHFPFVVALVKCDQPDKNVFVVPESNQH